jgi:hypothetical protein
MKGLAKELTGDELEPGLEVFDRVSREDIGREWGLKRRAGIGACPALSRHGLGALGADPRAGIRSAAPGGGRSEQV